MKLRSHRGEILAQVEPGPKFPDGILPRMNLTGFGRLTQPPGQGFFASLRAGRGEQLEQRAGTEQVEIRGVEVIVVGEAGATFSGPGPAVAYPGQPALVECDRPGDLKSSAVDP